MLAEDKLGDKKCKCRKGVHKGSSASPTLFITFIRSIVRYFRSNSASCKSPYVPGFGKVVLLLYADEILLISYSSKALQKLVKFTNLYCSAKSLVINVAKTDCLSFFADRQTWQICDSVKNGTHTVRYLGIHFDADGGWATQFSQLGPRVRLAAGRSKIITATLGWPRIEISEHFYDAMTSSVLRYALGAWRPLEPAISQFD